MRTAAIVLLVLAAAVPAPAGDVPAATVLLESLVKTLPDDVPQAAPVRFALFEDGRVFVGGTSAILAGRLEGSALKDLEKRVAAVRKLPGLSGAITLGDGSQRHRLVLRKGRPLDTFVSGDPARASASLRPLAELLRELLSFHHRSLRPYAPESYALRASEGRLAGGCRPWTLTTPVASAVFAPVVVPARTAWDWPTGARPASVCGDKTHVVTFRPLLPGETP